MNGTVVNGNTNGFSGAEKNGFDSGYYNYRGQDFSSITYESISFIAKWLKERTRHRPVIGIICGTGMNGLADKIENADKFPYKDIPGFPNTTVESHVGCLIFGKLNSIPVMCMQGRFHFYEGYPLARCCMPIKVMKLVGITNLIITNAAGGINKSYSVGDVMLIKDHINLMGIAGNGPLYAGGDSINRFGPLFFPMNQAYNSELIQIAKVIGKELNMEEFLQEGVYTCVGGPNYETVADVRMLKLIGADAVGMSTVHEVVTAKQMDMKVFAFSLITNLCVDEYDTDLNASHEEVIAAGLEKEAVLQEFVARMIVEINKTLNKQ